MATNLNLEEQDQLDALKHFWSRFGGAISTVLLLVLLSLAGWNGYRFWQARQASQASAMFDEVERAAGTSDLVLAQRAFDDMKQRYASTSYAPQAGLLVAKLAINDTPELRAELDRLLNERLDARLQAVQWDRAKAAERLQKLDEQIADLRDRRAEVIERQRAQLTKNYQKLRPAAKRARAGERGEKKSKPNANK